jgi:acyl-coenzyme A thioesterase 9
MINNKKEPRVEAYFTMVARDSTTYQATPVNSLQPETKEEKLFFERAAANAVERKRVAKISLLTTPPTDEERELIHKVFLETKQKPNLLASFHRGRNLPPEFICTCRIAYSIIYSLDMDSTLRETTVIMQPQERNIHNKVFGGYLMRKAYELAFVASYLFAGVPTVCKAVDDIAYKISLLNVDSF